MNSELVRVEGKWSRGAARFSECCLVFELMRDDDKDDLIIARRARKRVNVKVASGRRRDAGR